VVVVHRFADHTPQLVERQEARARPRHVAAGAAAGLWRAARLDRALRPLGARRQVLHKRLLLLVLLLGVPFEAVAAAARPCRCVCLCQRCVDLVQEAIKRGIASAVGGAAACTHSAAQCLQRAVRGR
jgi:hypothetical protein